MTGAERLEVRRQFYATRGKVPVGHVGMGAHSIGMLAEILAIHSGGVQRGRVPAETLYSRLGNIVLSSDDVLADMGRFERPSLRTEAVKLADYLVREGLLRRRPMRVVSEAACWAWRERMLAEVEVAVASSVLRSEPE